MKNPAIFDGAPLFDTAHKNVAATPSAPSIDSLQKMMLKLLRQTDPFGEAITIQPKYIIVPVGYGFLLSQLLETQVLDVTGIGSHPNVPHIAQLAGDLTAADGGGLLAVQIVNLQALGIAGITHHKPGDRAGAVRSQRKADH